MLYVQIFLTGLFMFPLVLVEGICYQSSRQCLFGDTFLNSHNLSYDYADIVKRKLNLINLGA